MEVPALAKSTKFNRWLPYWAVFQADLSQTLHSWAYRICVLIALLTAVGYMLYRVGVYKEAGIIQPASHLISDLLRWSVLGGVALVIVVTAGCISSERGIIADSVLSRGISRYQYFLGKWHARLTAIVMTFLVMGMVAVIASYFFLHEDMSLGGSLMALATVVALLAVVATCGVTVSALTSSTLLGIAILWIVLYGLGFAMSMLPAEYATPDRALTNLPYILRGLYDMSGLGQLIGYSLLASLLVAITGLAFFARRDV